MTHEKRLDLAYRHQMEVSKVVDLASVAAKYLNTGNLSDAVEDGDFFWDIADTDRKLDSSVQPLHEALKGIDEQCGGDDNPEIVMEYLTEDRKYTNVMGIYLQAAVPVLKGSSFSWGHCRLVWVFGNTYEEAFQAACEWAKEYGHDYD